MYALLVLICLAYLVAGTLWFYSNSEVRKTVDQMCLSNRVAARLAISLFILSWPYWVWKQIRLALLYVRTMRRVVRGKR